MTDTTIRGARAGATQPHNAPAAQPLPVEICHARVVERQLTDRSKAYDVEYLTADGFLLAVGCADFRRALDLAGALNEAAFLEIERTGR